MSQSATRTRLACLQDAMRPVAPVTARPIETIDPLFYLNASDVEFQAALDAKYGANENDEA